MLQQNKKVVLAECGMYGGLERVGGRGVSGWASGRAGGPRSDSKLHPRLSWPYAGR